MGTMLDLTIKCLSGGGIETSESSGVQRQQVADGCAGSTRFH
jgi:hypothetical protein